MIQDPLEKGPESSFFFIKTHCMQTVEIFTGLLFLGIGTFSFLAGVKNWDWFYRSRNASVFIRWFGRTKARYAYGTIGIIVIVMGILTLIGKIK